MRNKSPIVLSVVMLLLAAPLPIMTQGRSPSVAAPSVAPGSDDMALGPAFEVATIRPVNRSDGRRWFGVRADDSGHFMASAVSLYSLVQAAFGSVILDREAPKWVNSDDFDINAKVDDAYMAGWDRLSDRQRMGLVRPMVRKLLADRFKLKLRTEMQDTPVYALVQAKGGAKMKKVPAPPPPEGGERAQWEKQTAAMAKNPGTVLPGQSSCSWIEKVQTCIGKAAPMSRLLVVFMGFANLQVDRTVIDETGLKDYYDFSFTVSFDAGPPMNQIEDQLGLRFEPRRVPMKVYVIESAEKPSVDGA